MQAWQQRLSTLTARERWVLGLGVAAAVLILLYAFAWVPWQQELQRLRSDVPDKARTLAWMEQQAPRVEALMAENGPDASGASELPLLTLLERSATRAEIREQITRMSPGDEPDQVRVWMDDADFDRWLRWLESLQDSGIRVTEANIDRTGNNRVDIRTTLQR